MDTQRPLMIEASSYNANQLLTEWLWLVPESDTPLFISAFGDWVFGNPDGSLWVLSVLEGVYEKVALNSTEYNKLNKSPQWLDETFIAEWLPIAAENGLEPQEDECLGWKIHPMIGGKFEASNLQVFSMVVYQSLMGQFHRQLQKTQIVSKENKPWYKFW